MNLFHPTALPPQNSETFTTLLQHPNLSIEYIVSHSIDEGKWMTQISDEWVLLLQGEATLTYNDGVEKSLIQGEYLFIKANTKHRVKSTSKSAIWLAVHINVNEQSTLIKTRN